MATIYKYLPKEGYTKVDNKIFTIERKLLSDGAKVMYGFLASMQIGSKITDNYIVKSLDIGLSALKKYKRELKALDLIVVDRVGLNQYEMYIGSTVLRASIVKQYWEVKNDSKQTSLEDLEKLRNNTSIEILI